MAITVDQSLWLVPHATAEVWVHFPLNMPPLITLFADDAQIYFLFFGDVKPKIGHVSVIIEGSHSTVLLLVLPSLF